MSSPSLDQALEVAVTVAVATPTTSNPSFQKSLITVIIINAGRPKQQDINYQEKSLFLKIQ